MHPSGTMEVPPTDTGIRYYYFNMQGKEGSRGNAIKPSFSTGAILGFGGTLEVDLTYRE